MILYVMRHGTTVWNEKGITQGRTNNRLSAEGKKLTEAVSKDFCNEKIDLIVCSPLMRTVQTANIMNKYHKVKVIKDERLIEIDQGVFSGRKWTSLTEEEKILKKNRDKSCKMESFQEVEVRTSDFLKYILKNFSNKNILVVTHNVNASMLETLILYGKIDYSTSPNFKYFGNAQVKKFEIE